MIAGVWGRIASLYDMHVDAVEYLAVDDERVVVLGRYWGPARDGDSTVDAAFAHVITTRGDRSRGVAADHRHRPVEHSVYRVTAGSDCNAVGGGATDRVGADEPTSTTRADRSVRRINTHLRGR